MWWQCSVQPSQIRIRTRKKINKVRYLFLNCMIINVFSICILWGRCVSDADDEEGFAKPVWQICTSLANIQRRPPPHTQTHKSAIWIVQWCKIVFLTKTCNNFISILKDIEKLQKQNHIYKNRNTGIFSDINEPWSNGVIDKNRYGIYLIF